MNRVEVVVADFNFFEIFNFHNSFVCNKTKKIVDQPNKSLFMAVTKVISED